MALVTKLNDNSHYWPLQVASLPKIQGSAIRSRYGDLEAIEDFIAVGKDVNQVKALYIHSVMYASRIDSGSAF